MLKSFTSALSFLSKDRGFGYRITGFVWLVLANCLFIQEIATAAKTTIAVSPSSVTLTGSQTQQFTAAVMAGSGPVGWSLKPAVGTISATGFYTAPVSISSQQTITITATTAGAPAKSDTATVILSPTTPPPTISVSVTPPTASLALSQTQQLSASVTGTTNTAVTWTLSPAMGTVSATGLYAAPASLSSPQTVTVKATSVADTTKSASASVTVTPPVSVSMTPSMASLNASQTQQFTATVTGSTNSAVTWTLNPAVGTISAAGLYKAPASISSAQTVTVTATSAADSTKSASATETLNPPVAVSVTPSTASLTTSQTQQFTATVTGSTNSAVTWTLNSAVGTISAAGLYTAPASLSSPQTVAVKATSVADTTKSASASVTVTPPVSVTMTPSTASLTASQTQQFTATVTGSTNTAVTWTLNPAVGTVSTSGLYTAPASISSAQTVTVTATSAADSTKSASATETLNPPVAVSMTPSMASLTTSQTQQFTATVTGSGNQAVTWTLNPAVGTVSASGLYTAPSSISSAQTVTVTATSAADSTKSASASVSLTPPVTISMTPSAVSVTASQTQSFTATVAGTSNTGVNWSLNPAVGTLSTSGATAVYTAPASIPSSQAAQISAASMADTTKTANSLVTLVPAILISLAPTSINLQPGQTQQFTAAVSGTTNTAVTWSLNPAVGTISTNGLYTAPSSLTNSQAVTLTATSVADTTKSTTSTIIVNTGATFTINGQGITSLAYNGQSFYVPELYIMQKAIFRAPDGTETQIDAKLPDTTVKGSNPESLLCTYNAGKPLSFAVNLIWTMRDAATIRVDGSVTNNDPTQTLARINLYFLPFALPSPANQFAGTQSIIIDQHSGVPAGFLSGAWGSLVLWQEGYPTQNRIVAQYPTSDQTVFHPFFTNYSDVSPALTAENAVAPGQTIQFSYLLRFGGVGSSYATLTTDALLAVRTGVPSLMNWPNRRPIGNWFMADGTRRSTINPRGYFSDPTLDVSNSQTFSQTVLSRADQTIARMNSIVPRPQGIIIWDLEGQEFNHAFTYVGYPNQLPSLAPEMDAVADALFAKFTAAGYLPGLTLRPNAFGIGNQLPATCLGSSNYALSDKFINLTATFPNRAYYCASTAPNTWIATTNGPGEQQYVYDGNTILGLLQAKVSYARQRWGVRLFYVDSNVYGFLGAIDHQIFRSLVASFPDCLFFPEHATNYYWGSSAPYSQVSGGLSETPSSARLLYPNAFSLINLADGDLVSNQSTLIDGVRKGDILLFRAYYDSPEIPAMQSIYAAAAQ